MDKLDKHDHADADGKDPKGDKDHKGGKHAAALAPLKFAGVVLVCGECERRSDGPSKLGARTLRKSLKHGLGDARMKLRVVQSSCLGMCPKKAIALAALGPGTRPLGAAACDEDDAAAFAATVVKALR